MAAAERDSSQTPPTGADRAASPRSAALGSFLRLLAFQALLVQARDPQRWNAASCDRLSSYRRDPAPRVAIRAQFLFDADSA